MRGKSRVVTSFIAGDDDKHLEMTQGINPGRSKADEAARAVGGKVLLPIFAPSENSYPASLDPVTPEKYRKGLLSDQQKATIARMKQYTGFNDLATKSALGSEGVKRQVQAVVDRVIEHRQALARQEQQRERVHQQEIRPRNIAKIT